MVPRFRVGQAPQTVVLSQRHHVMRFSGLWAVRAHGAPPGGMVVFQHSCKMGLEGIVSKRLGSRYRSGRSPDWLQFKNPEAPAVRRESEEDWGR